MFFDKHPNLQAISVIAAAILSFAIPIATIITYNKTFHTDFGLYVRIASAVGCIVYMRLFMTDIKGPLDGVATACVVVWLFVASVFLVFGSIIAFMCLFGALQEGTPAPAYAFLFFYAAVGVFFAEYANS